MNKFIASAIIFLTCQIPVFATSKTEMMALQTLISKFSISMLGIAAFSIVIFIGLSLYNRFFVSCKIKSYNLKENSLQSPLDIDEALYMFIEKNRLL